VKRIIEAALDDADIPFVPNNPYDFHLPVQGVHIHVVPAISDARMLHGADNLILVKGRASVNALAAWIRGQQANP
jgi:hypothetical protein